MSNDNVASAPELSSEQLEAANVRGTIVELERQRNNAFTTAASKAGEYEKLRLIAGDLQRKLGEAETKIKNLDAQVIELTVALDEARSETDAIRSDLESERTNASNDVPETPSPRRRKA